MRISIVVLVLALVVGVAAGLAASPARGQGSHLDSLGAREHLTADGPQFDELPVVIGEPRDLPCLIGEANLVFTIHNVGNAALPDRPGTPEFYAIASSTKGGSVVAKSITSGVGPGAILGQPPLGGMATCDLSIPPDGSDTVTMRIAFPAGVNSIGALNVERGIWWDYDDDGVVDTAPVQELWRFQPDICNPLDVPCSPPSIPNREWHTEVQLPILGSEGQERVCQTWIEVQNVGPDSNKAILVTWAAPGACSPQCAGPLSVACSGLLRPGGTWTFLGAQIPAEARSGALFQVSTRWMSDLGVDFGIAIDDDVADVLCDALLYGVVGNCDNYRRFLKAYSEGGEFAGIPMNQRVIGRGLLAVDVLRRCSGDPTSTVEVASRYNGIASDDLGFYDPTFGGYAYFVPLVYADRAGLRSVLHVQNAGIECASVEIWFKSQDDCRQARLCEVFSLALGESHVFEATDCVGPDWRGSAWLRSTRVLATAVDTVGRDVLMTYVGEASQLAYAYDPLWMELTVGRVAYGPLIYSAYEGWDSSVQVQNRSSTTAAKVKVYLLDRGGDVVTALVDWICPRGSQWFFLPAVYDLPANWVGAVRVESQEWWAPGDPAVQAPDIAGVVTLSRYNDVARTQATEAIAYNLLPESRAYDWPTGNGRGDLDSGVGLIAIPNLVKDLGTTGLTTELAIANVVPQPGFTNVAVLIFDQNGLVDVTCENLSEQQAVYIDLQTWGHISPGFTGSAIISATFWDHEAFQPDGQYLRNVVGLAAVAIQRARTSVGDGSAGDQATGDVGIPLRESAAETAALGSGWEGSAVPVCPGVPVIHPYPGRCVPMPDGICRHDYSPATNPNGAQIEYVYIPGTSSVPAGGKCTDAVAPGTTRNWDATEFVTCADSGDLVVTMDSGSLSPYTGTSCGWSNLGINAYLFSVGIYKITNSAACQYLVQDSAQDGKGAGFMGPGSTFTFTSECWVHGAGIYTFASIPGCDMAGRGTVTGSAEWSFDFP
jgi:hypothetical protein